MAGSAERRGGPDRSRLNSARETARAHGAGSGRAVRIILPAALLIVAFAARLAILLTLEGKPLIAEPILDSRSYDQWAQRIAAKSFWGEGVFYQDPLYPYFLGIFYKIFGRHLLAVKVVQAGLGTLGVWFLFEAARRLSDFRVAVATLAVASFYRTTAFYDVVLLKEFLGPFFIEAALLTGVLALRKNGRGWWGGVTGVVLGLAALVRGNLLLLAPLAVATLWSLGRKRVAAIAAAGTALAIVPCAARNVIVAHEFVLTTAQFGENLYTGNNPDNWTGRYLAPRFMAAGAPEFEESAFRLEAERRLGIAHLTSGAVSGFWRDEALRAMREEPSKFLLATVRRLMLLTNTWEVPDNWNVAFLSRFSWALSLPWLTFGLPVWPLAAAGLFLSWHDRRAHWLPYVLLVGTTIPIAFFFVFDRYRLPAIPLLFYFAGYAIVQGARAWRAKERRAIAAAGIAAVTLIHSNLPASLYGVGDTSFCDDHYNLAIWYRKHSEPARAAAEMERAFEALPESRDDSEMALFAALSNVAAGRYSEAIPHFERAHDPQAAARCLDLARNEARSVEFFAWMVEKNPHHLGLSLDLAREQVRAGLKEEALKTLRRIASDHPSDPAPELERAILYEDLGLWREAAEAAEKALALASGDLPRAMEIRSEALRKLSR